ncbi:MAG: four-helix bundle copper-binding protein [Candidatus Latescibacterota bacterium]
MNRIHDMLMKNKAGTWTDMNMLTRCIQSCYDCAQSCTACADACLAEDSVKELVRCIRLNQDCADICETTGRMLSRLSSVDLRLMQSQLDACIAACQVCGDECNMHAGKHEHCRICAESCFSCVDECKEMLRSVQSAVH